MRTVINKEITNTWQQRWKNNNNNKGTVDGFIILSKLLGERNNFMGNKERKK